MHLHPHTRAYVPARVVYSIDHWPLTATDIWTAFCLLLCHGPVSQIWARPGDLPPGLEGPTLGGIPILEPPDRDWEKSVTFVPGYSTATARGPMHSTPPFGLLVEGPHESGNLFAKPLRTSPVDEVGEKVLTELLKRSTPEPVYVSREEMPYLLREQSGSGLLDPTAQTSELEKGLIFRKTYSSPAGSYSVPVYVLPSP